MLFHSRADLRGHLFRILAHHDSTGSTLYFAVKKIKTMKMLTKICFVLHEEKPGYHQNKKI